MQIYNSSDSMVKSRDVLLQDCTKKVEKPLILAFQPYKIRVYDWRLLRRFSYLLKAHPLHHLFDAWLLTIHQYADTINPCTTPYEEYGRGIKKSYR